MGKAFFFGVPVGGRIEVPAVVSVSGPLSGTNEFHGWLLSIITCQTKPLEKVVGLFDVLLLWKFLTILIKEEPTKGYSCSFTLRSTLQNPPIGVLSFTEAEGRRWSEQYCPELLDENGFGERSRDPRGSKESVSSRDLHGCKRSTPKERTGTGGLALQVSNFLLRAGLPSGLDQPSQMFSSSFSSFPPMLRESCTGVSNLGVVFLSHFPEEG